MPYQRLQNATVRMLQIRGLGRFVSEPISEELLLLGRHGRTGSLAEIAVDFPQLFQEVLVISDMIDD